MSIVRWVRVLPLLSACVAGCDASVSGPNRPPVASAGADQAGEVGEPVTLDGRGSYDPDGDALEYQWEIAAAPPGANAEQALTNARQVVAMLVPDRPGLWLVRLTVSDGKMASVPDVAEVRVRGGCETDSDCHDGVECTLDSCNVSTHTCENVPDDGLCPDDGGFCNGAEYCDVLQGCSHRGDPCPGNCDEQNDRCGECGDGTVNAAAGEQCDPGAPQDDHCCQAGSCLWVAAGGADPQGICGGAPACKLDVCDGNGNCILANATDDTPCGDPADTDCDNPDTCQGGVCRPNQEPNTTACRPTRGECDKTEYCPGDGPDCPLDEYSPDGTPCSGDAFSCTDDACQGGRCQSLANDDNCFWPARCMPTCSLSDSGCVSPPGWLSLECDSPVDLDSTDVSDCTITLSGGGDVTGQEDCLACAALAGVTTLVHADFSDDGNNCSLDGWTIESGSECYTTGTSCPMSGTLTRDCCDNFICPIDAFGTQAFAADRDTCTGGDRQWRLERTFNASGLQDLELCFDYADNGAAGNNDTLQVDIADASGNYQAGVFCDRDGPRAEVDDVWYRTCLDLGGVSFAAGNPALTIIFFLHSNDNNHRLYLDNITLRGVTSARPAARESIFSEDFTGCQNPLANGWRGWRVDGTIRCVTNFDCPDGSPRAEVDASSGSISRLIDASAHEDIQVCFHFGDDGTWGSADRFTFFLCTQNCTVTENWRPVWGIVGNAGPNQDCSRVCMNLSDLDGRADFNPSLGIGFSLTSDGGKFDLDNIEVTGSRPANAEGVISLTAPRDPDRNGTYDFQVTDEDDQLTGIVGCRWTPDAALHAGQRVWFRRP